MTNERGWEQKGRLSETEYREMRSLFRGRLGDEVQSFVEGLLTARAAIVREHRAQRVTEELLLTDALTGDNAERTPSGYYLSPMNVEYLVETVLTLAEEVDKDGQ